MEQRSVITRFLKKNSWLCSAVAASLATVLFASCDIIGRSKLRRYPEKTPDKSQPGQTPLVSELGFEHVPVASVQNLSNRQLAWVLTDALQFPVSARDLAAAAVARGDTFAAPDLVLGGTTDRLRSQIKIAADLSERFLAESPLAQSLLSQCSLPRDCFEMAAVTFDTRLTSLPGNSQTALPAATARALAALPEAARNSPQGKADAVKLALQRTLSSPRFWLFIGEHDGSHPAPQLTEAGLNWRLSLAFWRSAPLGEIPAGTLEEKTQAVMGSPKFERSWMEFVDLWLGLDFLPQAEKNTEAYPHWNKDSIALLREEIHVNALRLFREQRDISELISSNDWIVPPGAERFYADGQQALLEPRKGFLGSGAFAALTSGSSLTKPTTRGNFVLKKLLCEPVPPPPAGIGAIAPELSSAGLSTREKFASHAKQEPCASCHVKMDPIGFVLERLDPTGRFRADYSVLNAQNFSLGSAPIDTAVRLNLGNGDVDLNQITQLGDQVVATPQFRQCVVSSFLRFAFGLTPQQLSPAAQESLLQHLSDQKLSPQNLVKVISQIPSLRSVEPTVPSNPAAEEAP